MADKTKTIQDLRPFCLSNVEFLKREIGSGSYGKIEEVAIPGAICAAKTIHGVFEGEPGNAAEQQFVEECRRLSTLRHPHIVQFLGVCFPPGSQMPALVMEKLVTSLHDILDPQLPPLSFIPFGLKISILHDVARGLSFLHSHSPPIIHRDLSAKNVLLNEGMVAKIADLGMARIVPSLQASTMTMAPGATIYMPPEALEDKAKYNIPIDMFSFGVVTLFTLSEIFPVPKAATYLNEQNITMGRSELERRSEYVEEIEAQLGANHPLIELIKVCLDNVPNRRPTAESAIEYLEKAKTNIDEEDYDVNKLSLIQTLHHNSVQILSKDKQIKEQRQQNKQHKEEIEVLRSQIKSLEKHILSLQRQQMLQTRKKVITTVISVLSFISIHSLLI